MPSSSLSLYDNAQTPVATTYALAGATAMSALWRDTSRVLSLPNTVEMTVKQSPSGSKANDKVIIQLRDVRADSTNQLMTGLIRIELSVPKNADWTEKATEDLLVHVAHLLNDNSLSACALIAKGTIV